MRHLAEKAVRCCSDLAAFTEAPGRITRTFLSPPMRDVHRVLGEWMRGLGMEVRVDAAGNLRGLYGNAGAPRLLVGSHLDTVPDAGAFDGILGVVLGICLVELMPSMAIEVIGFSEEEGVRFGLPFFGSRAVAGTLDDRIVNAAREGVVAFGLDPAELPQARFAPQAIGYIEFHIEQGPVLESLNLPLGIVEAIAGQTRLLLTFEGKANHAGTTPMALRNDALTAAARWILEVERYARATPGLVATVGALQVSPNAGNVIPGRVQASLDVRHACDSVRHEAVHSLLATAKAAHYEVRMDQAAVAMDEGLCDLLAGGEALHRMTSGAGHDAMVMAPQIPSTMLFLRSPGGISHHPDESVLVEDVEAALYVGAGFVERLAARG